MIIITYFCWISVIIIIYYGCLRGHISIIQLRRGWYHTGEVWEKLWIGSKSDAFHALQPYLPLEVGSSGNCSPFPGWVSLLGWSLLGGGCWPRPYPEGCRFHCHWGKKRKDLYSGCFHQRVSEAVFFIMLFEPVKWAYSRYDYMTLTEAKAIVQRPLLDQMIHVHSIGCLWGYKDVRRTWSQAGFNIFTRGTRESQWWQSSWLFITKCKALGRSGV